MWQNGNEAMTVEHATVFKTPAADDPALDCPAPSCAKDISYMLAVAKMRGVRTPLSWRNRARWRR